MKTPENRRNLTRTQLAALKQLEAGRAVYLDRSGRRHDADSGTRRTLQSLIDRGLAEWCEVHKGWPHIEKVGTNDHVRARISEEERHMRERRDRRVVLLASDSRLAAEALVALEERATRMWGER